MVPKRFRFADAGEGVPEDVLDERRLPGAGDTGDGNEKSKRDLDVRKAKHMKAAKPGPNKNLIVWGSVGAVLLS